MSQQYTTVAVIIKLLAEKERWIRQLNGLRLPARGRPPSLG